MNKLDALEDRAIRMAIVADRTYLERHDAHTARYLARHARRAMRAADHAYDERTRRIARLAGQQS